MNQINPKKKKKKEERKRIVKRKKKKKKKFVMTFRLNFNLIKSNWKIFF